LLSNLNITIHGELLTACQYIKHNIAAAELELEAPVTHEENPAGYWRLAESQLPKCRDQKI